MLAMSEECRVAAVARRVFQLTAATDGIHVDPHCRAVARAALMEASICESIDDPLQLVVVAVDGEAAAPEEEVAPLDEAAPALPVDADTDDEDEGAAVAPGVFEGADPPPPSPVLLLVPEVIVVALSSSASLPPPQATDINASDTARQARILRQTRVDISSM